VLPLLKKAGLDRDDMSSYRPISNLTTASEVIERLFLNRLRPQLLGSRNFSRLQSAYRRGHSTETTLLHVLNGVYTAADQKRVTGLDMSAAFDTIDHDVLLERLYHRFGVRDAASYWLRSYLTNRQQFGNLSSLAATRRSSCHATPAFHKGLFLNRCCSPPTQHQSGDLIVSFGVCYHQFADDTQLFIAMNAADTAPALD